MLGGINFAEGSYNLKGFITCINDLQEIFIA